MPTIDLGRIKPIWQGQWAGSTAYVKDDIVRHGVDSYICVTAHTSDASTFSNDSANWELMTQGAEQSGFQSMQVFDTAGSYTWTKPDGITKIRVIVTGGGGGGGGMDADDLANGGGAGATCIKVIDVTSVSSVQVTVGSAGGGGANGVNSSATGGTSSFGSYCTATGGNRYGGNWGLGGYGGSASGGDINIEGGDGIGGFIDGPPPSSNIGAGTGGASYWGQGGRGGSKSTTSGRTGRAYGSGGGGSANTTASPNGTAGVVVVEEYK